MIRTISIGGCDMFDWYMWHQFEHSGKVEDYLVYCEEKMHTGESPQQPVTSGEQAVNL